MFITLPMFHVIIVKYYFYYLLFSDVLAFLHDTVLADLDGDDDDDDDMPDLVD